MKKTSTVLRIALLVAGFMAVVGPALAQDKPADNMQILLDKIKADKKLLVAQNMGLTESEAKAFWPVYNTYQKDLLKIREQMGALIGEYAKNYQSMTNPAANKLLDDLVTLKTDHAKLIASSGPQFRKILPDTKVARYFQIENKVDAILSYELAKVIPLVK